MTWLDDSIRGVRDFDRARPRSRQAQVGWSEAGGCRSAIGFRLEGAYATETDTWAAQRGTAVHDYILPILARLTGGRAEVRTVYRGIPGHADLVDGTGVTDVKTTTMENSLRWMAKPDLLRTKRIQANGYAAGLVDSGELPADCTVRILVIPVDGTFDDWWVYEEPFSRELADEGANRVEWVRAQLEAGEPLPQDKPRYWCQAYCGFFDLCQPGNGAGTGTEITDPELAAAVAAYGEAHEAAAPLIKRKEALAALIRGLQGTAGEWRISLSKPGDPGQKPNMDAIRAFYAEHGGGDLPMTETPGKSPSLSVTRIKKQEAEG